MFNKERVVKLVVLGEHDDRFWQTIDSTTGVQLLERSMNGRQAVVYYLSEQEWLDDIMAQLGGYGMVSIPGADEAKSLEARCDTMRRITVMRLR